jgi:hypothetical protein
MSLTRDERDADANAIRAKENQARNRADAHWRLKPGLWGRRVQPRGVDSTLFPER